MNFKNIAALFLLASTTALAQVTDPVLMRVNGKEVTRSEFEYAFNKNNSNLADKGQTVDEYLPMYIDFKLKVAEAEALRLDTLSSFKEEFERDRKLMAENYLVDTCFINEEAYRVYAKDSATIGRDGFIEVAHIVFLANQTASVAEVELAKARIDSAYAMLNEEKSFEDVAAFFQVPAQATRPFEIVKVGTDMPRDVLYDRINRRVDLMMEAGLEAEARALYHLRHLNSLQTVGYRELFEYFDGNCTLDEAVELIKRNSRRYAKRQLTWFRRDTSTGWFSPSDLPSIIEFIDSHRQ
mgnify:CR=1 FL=1